MNYQEYIKPELLVLVPVLYFVGVWLKKSRFPDRFIPLMLGGAAVFMSALWTFATSDISSTKAVLTAVFISVTQGILAAGASVCASQIHIQVGKKSKTDPLGGAKDGTTKVAEETKETEVAKEANEANDAKRAKETKEANKAKEVKDESPIKKDE